MKYIFHLTKWSGFKKPLKKKRVVIEAANGREAYFTAIPTLYPDWDISMFWPKYPLTAPH